MMNKKSDAEFDRNTPIALYYQLKEKMLKKILNGEWKPGHKIPSEMELCEIYNVSRITVRKAIDELVRSDYLTSQQGKGTFVQNTSVEHRLSKFYSFSEELKKRGMNEYVKMLSFEAISASDRLNEKLFVESNSQLFMITRLRFVDETPYTIETSYIPLNICPNLTENSVVKNGLYNSMRSLGIFPERAIEKFRATAMSKPEAKLMQLKPGTPSIHLERTTYAGARAIEYCSSVVRGDFFTYTVELKS